MEQKKHSISIKNTNLVMTVAALIVAVLLIVATYVAGVRYQELRTATDHYIQWQKDASDLQTGSDVLTEQVRCFAETGDRAYLDGYFEEAEVTQLRDTAVAQIYDYVGDTPAYHALVTAMEKSVALMDREYYSMRLKIEACGYDLNDFPKVLQEVKLSDEDAALSAEEKDVLARSMVFDDEYHTQKEAITEDVQKCLGVLAEEFEGRRTGTADRLNRLMLFQRILIAVSIAITLLTVVLVLWMIVRPLYHADHYVREEKLIPVSGAREIRFVAETYNTMYETGREQRQSIRSLLNNMPVLSFSKDVETGAYRACNQAFAEYAGKKTPEEAVGLTDEEIFDPQTAAHFIEDDRKAVSMDEPYIFFETVLNAEGDLRQFQTTKLKFVDETGRQCLLGMAMDVTEVERVKKENEQTRAAYQEALSTSAVYESIVETLTEDYFDLYYVDLETEDYIEYGSSTEGGKRTMERRGTDFFAETRKRAQATVYEEDRDHFLEVLEKDKLLTEINRYGMFIFYYRQMIDGVSTYVRLKAARVLEDDRHVIVGISNVDSQVRDRMAAEQAEEERKTYTRLSALSGNLIFLYYVDPETNEFTEFSASEGYKGLGIARQGSDFFQSTFENSKRTIHPEDLPLFHAQVTKENILAAIERDGVFVLAYRLMNDDLPTYVRLKAAQVEENGKPMLIIGLMDEDAQVRQEQKYVNDLSVARKMATVDSLTGVKNKHAYVQWEEEINEKIQDGSQEPFAVVVCDINNLKAVNDVYGHKEGDACIRKACMRICGIFSHSPVFRIGGDEFVVLMSGEDYLRRKTLMEQVSAVPADSSKIMIGETIAAGIAEYRKDAHASVLQVFEEADKLMYERKQQMKEAVLREDATHQAEPVSEEIPVMNVRKCVLIADDIEMNREMLGDLLEEDYDILYASDGVETLDVLRSHIDEIDLVLLDLIMPNMNGREVIAQMQIDENLMSVPVIFLTTDQEAELDCLRIGAMDFIPKPYPDIEIVKARIAKCIELSEDRELIRHTERDKLTGLLNKDYFFRYVSRLDQLYKGTELDAVVCDVNGFHSINKQYGRQFGDQVLHGTGICIRELARETGGISCRQSSDTFLLYCPHQEDYEQLLGRFTGDVLARSGAEGKVSLRFGVFRNAQKEAEIEKRFLLAKSAADSIKEDPQKICGFCETENS